MEDNYEKLLSKMNIMKEIREIAESNPTFQDKLIESIQTPIYLVREIFKRQYLKDILFEIFNAILDEEIEVFWKVIYQIDKTITHDDSTKKYIKQRNVGITITCTEYNKSQLLLSAKKISDKDRQILHQFLDTILYTCRILFKNTNELTSANRCLDDNDNTILPKIVKSLIESNNENGNDNSEKSSNFEYDIAVSDKEDNQNDHDTVKPKNFDSSEDTISDSIQKLFTHIFVNDSRTYASPIEKLYYSAKFILIYVVIAILLMLKE
ncbi:1976_t:CDS:2 [Scutellospora calospora]|uniref:1976_t:CDS:1 n=1 Tax=Scutellospora calospora TaxID=85575 RepID=A0ACA9MHC0_9GLOM|nr:1976_t:CDS:2 [Scutellospora calospora]